MMVAFSGPMRTFRGSMCVVLSLALLALVLWAPRADARASVMQSNERFTFVGATVAGCNDETLVAEFTVHNVSTIVINGTGGATVRFHQNVHGTAIGSAGNEYVVAGIANTTVTNHEPDGGFQFTVTNPLHNVSEGSADNLLVIAVTHTTVNANGDVTAETTNFETRCVG
jgi:hypothetical protein